MADIYTPVRAGTDIAFLGGIIRYLLENDLWFRDLAIGYTNIATGNRSSIFATESTFGLMARSLSTLPCMDVQLGSP